MTNESNDLQRDEELAGGQEQAFAAQIDNRLKNVHTILPAVIVSFDPVKQTATVQPLIMRVFAGVPTNLPVCVDCPVQFPQGGGFVLTFPLVPGDEVLLAFAERAIDNWYAAGGAQPPSEYRMHDLSDGFVIAGINNQQALIPAFNTGAIELRNRAGTNRISMTTSGAVSLVNGSGSVVLAASGTIALNGNTTVTGTLHVTGDVTGDGTVTGSTDVVGGGKSLKGHKHTGVTTGLGISGPPQ